MQGLSAGAKVVGAWFISVVLLVLAISGLITSHSIVGFVAGITAAAICFPPIRRQLSTRTGFALSTKFTAIAVIALYVVQSILMQFGSDRLADDQATAAQVAKAQALAVTMKKDSDYFIANKATVLSGIREKLAAGRLEEASADANRYRLADPDLSVLKHSIEVAFVKRDLKDEGSLSLDRRVELYGKLAQLEPSNAQYVAAATKLETQVDAARRQTEFDRQLIADAQRRKDAIDSQFSPWDGSHRAVERAIKASMKNPNSYEHVGTRYSTTKNGLVVVTTFRGTNSFNAIITNIAVAKVDSSGRVTSLSIN